MGKIDPKSQNHTRVHDEIVVKFRVIPRANHNQICEPLDDGRIKIRLSAPPVQGKANKALINYLADILDIPERQITIKKGHTSRDKLVSIRGVDLDYFNQRIIGSIKSAHK